MFFGVELSKVRGQGHIVKKSKSFRPLLLQPLFRELFELYSEYRSSNGIAMPVREKCDCLLFCRRRSRRTTLSTSYSSLTPYSC